MKIILKYGIIVGVVVFVYIILELVLGLHDKYLSVGQYTGYLRYLLLAAGIYVGTNDLRYEQPEIDITFWQALGKGLGISAVAGVIICISEWLYIDFINPKFVQDFTEFTINKLKAANASAEHIAAVMEQAQIWKPLEMQLLLYFAETMILGSIFSLIVSIVLITRNRKRRIA
ncbi:DUF4199 domain-containing protein [candidate division KSB1 bacterium]|nr:DUF4199 domain-containing protein [candidate division KSB1 bacterium]